MNERGFFTIVGLCLLLATALCIQGVQEFEGNYSVGAKSFQVEHELQNAADSALVEAAEKIHSSKYVASYKYQQEIPVSKPIVSERLKNFSVKVYAEYFRFARYRRTYDRNNKYKDKIVTDEKNKSWVKRATVLISVASCDSDFTDGKNYRRALAYILDGDKTVHFLNDLSRELNDR